MTFEEQLEDLEGSVIEEAYVEDGFLCLILDDGTGIAVGNDEDGELIFRKTLVIEDKDLH
jgi:hypothetical protein